MVQRQQRWNRGGARYWGLACRQKGPAPATKYFSGNGIALASMCAARQDALNKVELEVPEIDWDLWPQECTSDAHNTARAVKTD